MTDAPDARKRTTPDARDVTATVPVRAANVPPPPRADEPPSDSLIVTCRGCGARWDLDRDPQACECTDLDDVDWTIHAE